MDRFTIPMAGKDVLGAVKVGRNLGIEKDGTLYVQGIEELEKGMDAAIRNASAGKAAIAAAITERGVPTEAGAPFAQMADNVRMINSGYSYGCLDAGCEIVPYTLVEVG